mgnify:CR=1 FL=1
MLEIGSVIDGRYKILNEVGRGGMSVVYLAMNEKANKQWAVKEVRKDGRQNFEVVKQAPSRMVAFDIIRVPSPMTTFLSIVTNGPISTSLPICASGFTYDNGCCMR